MDTGVPPRQRPGRRAPGIAAPGPGQPGPRRDGPIQFGLPRLLQWRVFFPPARHSRVVPASHRSAPPAQLRQLVGQDPCQLPRARHKGQTYGAGRADRRADEAEGAFGHVDWIHDFDRIHEVALSTNSRSAREHHPQTQQLNVAGSHGLVPLARRGTWVFASPGRASGVQPTSAGRGWLAGNRSSGIGALGAGSLTRG